MTAPVRLLGFRVDGQRYAVALDDVERVVRVVELNRVAGLPEAIRGIFDLGGKIVAVADIRRRLGLPDRPDMLDDCIVVLRLRTRLLAVLTEGDTALLECATADIDAATDIVGKRGTTEGIARLSDGLVLIQNLERFLSIDEERKLDEALDAAR